ncbi:hypothetical protein ACFLYN_02200 [Chloroflexota bacterium]
MKELTGADNGTNILEASGNADPKSRIAEYFAEYYGYSNDVRSILNETKVGALRRQNSNKTINSVFSRH